MVWCRFHCHDTLRHFVHGQNMAIDDQFFFVFLFPFFLSFGVVVVVVVVVVEVINMM